MGPKRIRASLSDNLTDLELICSARPILTIDHKIHTDIIVRLGVSQVHLVVISLEVYVPVRSPDIPLIIPVHNFHRCISINIIISSILHNGMTIAKSCRADIFITTHPGRQI
jgi:hypothetical protein